LINILKSSSKETFIDELVNFIIDNYREDFSKLKILLPNGLICSELQHSLIKRLGTIILPNIIPISALVAEEEEIFKIPSEQIGAITRLEEKLTLSEVISSYKNLNYDLSQSLRLSPALAQLFFDFEANNLEFKNIQNLPKLDESEHWNMIYNFLSFAQLEWLNKVKSMKKMTRASYQTLIFEAEINRLKCNQDEFLIIAGVVGNSEITNNFIRNASKLSNAYLILPPFNEKALTNKLNPENPFYKIQKLLIGLDNNQQDIKTLGTPQPGILDKLLSESESVLYNDNLEYIELENAFHEAEYIALKCQENISNNPECRIAIITHAQEAKEQCATFLDKYGLKYNDLFGEDIIKHQGISLIILIAELLYSKFSTKNLFSLLSHQAISDKDANEIKNIIRKNNRLASSLEAIKQTISKHGSPQVINKFYDIANLIAQPTDSNDFHYLLKRTLQFSEKLIPDIWIKYSDINSPLSEIMHKKWSVQVGDTEIFPELIKQVLEGGRISGTKSNNNIILCRPSDTALINYDLVIISDINENRYPKSTLGSPWLNLQMQKELGLDSKISAIGSTLYEFYLNIHNKKTILTRSKKSGGTQTLPSPFILHLQYILGNKLRKKTAIIKPINSIKIQKEIVATGDYFPKQISATDIETLIRSPYNFYTKKILKLRKMNEISDKPSLADFGNFFHQIAEDYTNNFPNSSIEDLSGEYLKKLDIPEYSKKSWMTKILSIAPEFIKFEKSRRQEIASVHCEIKGTLQLNIKGKKIDILAIADRIEVGKDGNVYIMDYKTGAIPTRTDVLSGLSPQLIVESIILAEGGFNIPSIHVKKIIYVKINSNKPYLKMTEIDLSTDEIKRHKNGLISLFEHYITTNTYPIEPCQMKYDDYTHFARRL
jgi:ATP-dependent helicase/nuclease subunit B